MEVAAKGKTADVRSLAISALRGGGPGPFMRGGEPDPFGRGSEPDPKLVISALPVILKDESVAVRLEMLRLVRELGPEAKEVIPILLAALQRTQDNSERVEIVNALGRMGPAAKEAVPALTEIRNRKPEGNEGLALQAAVTKALKQINK